VQMLGVRPRLFLHSITRCSLVVSRHNQSTSALESKRPERLHSAVLKGTWYRASAKNLNSS